MKNIGLLLNRKIMQSVVQNRENYPAGIGDPTSKDLDEWVKEGKVSKSFAKHAKLTLKRSGVGLKGRT